jgi:lysophospholipase L1-like esterase
VKIQINGDSVDWGRDGETGLQSVNAPVFALQRQMDARFGTGVVHVENRAVPGSRADQLIEGTDGLNLPWPGSVDAHITVANFGINDMFVADVPTYKANLRKLRGVTVFVTQNPISLPVWGETGQTYAQAMRDVAAELGTPVADVNAYVRSLPNWEAYEADNIHPNGTLYGLIVTNVLLPKLEPLVAKLRCESGR